MDGALEGRIDGAERGPGSGAPRTGFAALLPTRTLPRFTPNEFLKTLNGMIGATGARAELVPDLTRFEQSPGGTRVWHRPQVPPRVGVTVGGITLLVEGQDRPALGADDAAALGFRSWPAGAREIARARAHIRVAEVAPALGAELDVNHDRAAALTAVAATALELAQALGLVWEASRVAVPAGEMLAAVPALMAGEAPLALWIGAEARSWGAVTTRGLYPLLGAEIELRARGIGAAAAERIVTGLAAEIVETGRLPADGATIEAGSRGAVRVGYRGAEEGGLPAITLDEAIPGKATSSGPAMGQPGAADLAAGAA
jgi:hypothetical protein